MTEMESKGQVLSDVHAHMTGQAVSTKHGLSESRFYFKLPNALIGDVKEKRSAEESSRLSSPCKGSSCDVAGDRHLEYDEDGDLIIQRASGDEYCNEIAITIVHAMATDLNLVGQQVWPGALLLCDFILHYSPLFRGRVVVDVGAGAGLTSVVAALTAKLVLCTDRGEDVLNVASLNVDRNRPLLRAGDVRVRWLDWTDATPAPEEMDSRERQRKAAPFDLTFEDTKALYGCSTVLAAEAIYDLELSDALFTLLYELLRNPPGKTVYMTVEKRQVFTTQDREVVSPAYEHFRENLRDLSSIDEGLVRFLCSQVDLGFPQYFHYQRTKELELWKIEAVFVER